MSVQILVGDALQQLRLLATASVQCVATSPPYWGLRDYGVDGQIGLEASPDQYVAQLVTVFRQVRRVLRRDGTLWLNLGDSYTDGGRGADVLQRDKPHGQRPPGKNGVAKSAKARHALAVRGTRNARTVWTITPRPFRDAHFATFPPALVEPCILAGTSPRCCELCGAPWRAVYGDAVATGGRGSGNKERSYRHQRGGPTSKLRRQAHSVPRAPSVVKILDWRSDCDCSLATGVGRCVVLDPFAGAGTTGLVAQQLGRDSILIELNPTYAAMAERRIASAIESEASA